MYRIKEFEMDYRIDFERLEWEIPFEGVRHKFLDQNGTRLRLVEYSENMPPHWCERGHVGILLEGRMEIEYVSETVLYKKGDGVHIPSGEEHRHRAVILSEIALCLFVENINNKVVTLNED
ncbi:cupin domain-containing protein [bacterium]|nr:cupin domain-containing protein [bacterium]